MAGHTRPDPPAWVPFAAIEPGSMPGLHGALAAERVVVGMAAWPAATDPTAPAPQPRPADPTPRSTPATFPGGVVDPAGAANPSHEPRGVMWPVPLTHELGAGRGYQPTHHHHHHHPGAPSNRAHETHTHTATHMSHMPAAGRQRPRPTPASNRPPAGLQTPQSPPSSPEGESGTTTQLQLEDMTDKCLATVDLKTVSKLLAASGWTDTQQAALKQRRRMCKNRLSAKGALARKKQASRGLEMANVGLVRRVEELQLEAEPLRRRCGQLEQEAASVAHMQEAAQAREREHAHQQHHMRHLVGELREQLRQLGV